MTGFDLELKNLRSQSLHRYGRKAISDKTLSNIFLLERRMSELPQRGQACIVLHFLEGDWFDYRCRRGDRSLAAVRLRPLRVWVRWTSLLMVVCKRARKRSIFAASSSMTIFLDTSRTVVKSNTLDLLSGDRLWYHGDLDLRNTGFHGENSKIE